MRKFGLIGYPLGHSYSADFFNEMFKSEGIDATYSNYEMKSLDGLRDLVTSEGLSGFNVTIPHKVNILEQLDYLDPHADIIGAVNTVVVEDYDGYKALHGYNTDYVAFGRSIMPLMQAQHVSALILGTGGASKAVFHGLKQLGVESTFVSRTAKEGCITYADLTREMMDRYTVIVNTTPLGMFPNVDSCPDIPYEWLTPNHLLYDLLYNPDETLFMRRGKERGAVVKNGLEMLLLQAFAAWEIWNDKK